MSLDVPQSENTPELPTVIHPSVILQEVVRRPDQTSAGFCTLFVFLKVESVAQSEVSGRVFDKFLCGINKSCPFISFSLLI